MFNKITLKTYTRVQSSFSAGTISVLFGRLWGHSSSSCSSSSPLSLPSRPCLFPFLCGLLVPRSLHGLHTFTGAVPSFCFFWSSSRRFLTSRGLSLMNLQSPLLIASSKHQRPGSEVKRRLGLTNFSKVQPWSSTPYFWMTSSS